MMRKLLRMLESALQLTFPPPRKLVRAAIRRSRR